MNNTVLLHIVERLEGFLGKLPDSIRNPVLNELTPLKELFLQQRPPRFVLTGSHPMPLLEFAAQIFAEGARETPPRETLTGLYRWQKISLGHHGSIQLLDARGADEAALALVRDELKSQPADLFFFLPAERAAKVETRKEAERLERMLNWNSSFGVGAKLIELRNNAADSLWPLAQATEAPAIHASLLGVHSLAKRFSARWRASCLTRHGSRWCGSAAIARRRARSRRCSSNRPARSAPRSARSPFRSLIFRF